jgi:hypothetical protein
VFERLEQPTRIILARGLGEYIIPDDKEESSTSCARARASQPARWRRAASTGVEA